MHARQYSLSEAPLEGGGGAGGGEEVWVSHTLLIFDPTFSYSINSNFKY